MSLNYAFRRAVVLIDGMNAAERARLSDLCSRVRAAEEELTSAASRLLQDCGVRCRGICCRNLEMDAVIAYGDFVYILEGAAWLGDAIARNLEREEPFYTSNCPFLEGGVGPCIFPADLRPEVCVTSFCRDDAEVRAEIRRVRRCFRRLGWFLFLSGWRGRFRARQRTAAQGPDAAC